MIDTHKLFFLSCVYIHTLHHNFWKRVAFIVEQFAQCCGISARLFYLLERNGSSFPFFRSRNDIFTRKEAVLVTSCPVAYCLKAIRVIVAAKESGKFPRISLVFPSKRSQFRQQVGTTLKRPCLITREISFLLFSRFFPFRDGLLEK